MAETQILEEEETEETIVEEPDVAERRGESRAIKFFLIVVSILLVVVSVIFAGYILLNTDNKAKQFIQKYDVLGIIVPKDPTVSQTTAPAAVPAPAPAAGLFAMPMLSINNNMLQVEEAEEPELTTEQIAQAVMPSVVGIQSYDYDTGITGTSVGTGSGIIMSADGYIITNAHVVMADDEITAKTNFEVHLYDETVLEATLVGADRKTDLAVLKVNSDKLVPAKFGDSDKIVVGARAVAIGNPTGLQLSGSLTQGVISGIHRSIPVGFTGAMMPCIQTDAPINPGNSGGALINKFGQVIGVNSIKISSTSYEGIGFAIPINTVKPIVDELIEYGSIQSRPKLGITITTVPTEFLDKVSIPAGVRVVAITEDTDAYKKGILKGDIITAVDGTPVLDNEQFIEYVHSKKIGESVNLTVFRIEKNKEVTKDISVRAVMDKSGDVK